MTDENLSMLAYWVEDKGLETAFRDYYPELAQSDLTINQALRDLHAAKSILLTRVRELTERARDENLPSD